MISHGLRLLSQLLGGKRGQRSAMFLRYKGKSLILLSWSDSLSRHSVVLVIRRELPVNENHT